MIFYTEGVNDGIRLLNIVTKKLVKSVLINVFLVKLYSVNVYESEYVNSDRLSSDGYNSFYKRLLKPRGVVLENDNIALLGGIEEIKNNKVVAVLKGVLHRGTFNYRMLENEGGKYHYGNEGENEQLYEIKSEIYSSRLLGIVFHFISKKLRFCLYLLLFLLNSLLFL